MSFNVGRGLSFCVGLFLLWIGCANGALVVHLPTTSGNKGRSMAVGRGGLFSVAMNFRWDYRSLPFAPYKVFCKKVSQENVENHLNS